MFDLSVPEVLVHQHIGATVLLSASVNTRFQPNYDLRQFMSIALIYVKH